MDKPVFVFFTLVLITLSGCSFYWKLNYLPTENNETLITNQTVEVPSESKNELETWISGNNKLERINDSKVREKLYESLEKHCYKLEDDKCSIKLECLPVINKELLGLNYSKISLDIKEEENSNLIDSLVEKKSGHWLSYTLLFEAEYTYLLNKCLKTNATTIVLKSWYDDSNPTKYSRKELDHLNITGKYVIEKYWLDYDLNWYLPDVTAIQMENGYIYPNIVCGNWYARFFVKKNGPCGIAFTKSKITSLTDLSKLDKVLMVEPYGGETIGVINDTISFIYILNKENYDYYTSGEFSDIESYIVLVITDNMVYGYSKQKQEWVDFFEFVRETWSEWLEDKIQKAEIGF